LADDRIPLLATVPLFGDLSARELTEVLGAGKDIEFPAGRMIVEEGSIGTDFYLILSGDATVSKGGRVIRRLRPGDFFGEISLLDGGPRSATVVAEGHVLAFRLNRPVMLRLLDRERSIARKVLLEVIKRLRSAERKAFY
jgi:CRP/FNR family cyclic AMP-dependent transcriptional regulator